MELIFKINGRTFTADTDHAVSLAKPLDFDSTQTDFAAPPPDRQPLRSGSFVGDTREGGGCNVDQLSLIPHCHGTHTETVGHIVDQQVPIAETQLPLWMMCALLTVTPEPSAKTDEEYEPAPATDDGLMTAAGLKLSYDALALTADDACLEAYSAQPAKALIVRCRAPALSPGEARTMPPYFSMVAIRWCHEFGIQHLLVESPSIDRVEDGGLLTNHHTYWNVPPGTHALSPDSWTHKTITESITIPPVVADGIYLLNLQVPSFLSDAAPSQPMIVPLHCANGAGHGEA